MKSETLDGKSRSGFSPKDIYKRVWNENPYGSESTVAVHIRHS